MTWAAVGIAGATVVGSMISAQGAQSAASEQAGAALNAQNISQNEFNTIVGQESPFMQAGYGSVNQLDYLLGEGSPYQYNTTNYKTGGNLKHPGVGINNTSQYSSPAGSFGSLLTPFNMSDWQQLSPAYNFALQQGRQGVLNGDSGTMGALSGAAQKDLIGYNQNMANTWFNNAFNMYQTQQGNIYQRLAGMAQLGQNAAANTGQQGTSLAGQAAQSATNIGTAMAGGTVGAANAYSGAISSMGYMPWLMQSGGGGAGAGGGGGGAYSPVLSDRRMKENIKRIGKTDAGLPVYVFNYKGQHEICMGVMSDEVIEKFPEAVIRGEDGFDRVNYGVLE